MNRQEAIELACKCANRRPESYYSEPFTPHEWVVDAILEAASFAEFSCASPGCENTVNVRGNICLICFVKADREMDQHNRDVMGLNNEGDTIGGDGVPSPSDNTQAAAGTASGGNNES